MTEKWRKVFTHWLQFSTQHLHHVLNPTSFISCSWKPGREEKERFTSLLLWRLTDQLSLSHFISPKYFRNERPPFRYPLKFSSSSFRIKSHGNLIPNSSPLHPDHSFSITRLLFPDVGIRNFELKLWANPLWNISSPQHGFGSRSNRNESGSKISLECHLIKHAV